jgi:hypothetical protein
MIGWAGLGIASSSIWKGVTRRITYGRHCYGVLTPRERFIFLVFRFPIRNDTVPTTQYSTVTQSILHPITTIYRTTQTHTNHTSLLTPHPTTLPSQSHPRSPRTHKPRNLPSVHRASALKQLNLAQRSNSAGCRFPPALPTRAACLARCETARCAETAGRHPGGSRTPHGLERTVSALRTSEVRLRCGWMWFEEVRPQAGWGRGDVCRRVARKTCVWVRLRARGMICVYFTGAVLFCVHVQETRGTRRRRSWSPTRRYMR